MRPCHHIPISNYKFQGIPIFCHWNISKFLTTRLAHIVSAKGTFCLLRGGMVIGADSKTLLKQLAHSGYPCTVVSTDGPSMIGIAFPVCGQGFIGTRILLYGYEAGMTFCLRPCPVLFGVVTHLPAKNCYRAQRRWFACRLAPHGARANLRCSGEREVVRILPSKCGEKLSVVVPNVANWYNQVSSIVIAVYTVEACPTVPESCKGGKAMEDLPSLYTVNFLQATRMPYLVFVCAAPSPPR